jgi:hypothetical protein
MWVGGDWELNVTDRFVTGYLLAIFLLGGGALLSCSADSASSQTGGPLDGGADSDSDGDSDSDADGDTDTDVDSDSDSETEDTDTSAADASDGDAGETTTDDGGDAGFVDCAGAIAGGHCWYLSAEQGSCEETCAAHGGFDDATSEFAGSGGTDEHCAEVLDALDASGSSVYQLMGIGSGIGCTSLSGARYRVSDEITTADATYVLARRACACAE